MGSVGWRPCPLGRHAPFTCCSGHFALNVAARSFAFSSVLAAFSA